MPNRPLPTAPLSGVARLRGCSLIGALVTACAAVVGCDPPDEEFAGEDTVADEDPEFRYAYSSVVFPVDKAGDWRHAGGSPFHRPHGGYAKANDQYCLDLNLPGDGDWNAPVHPIRSGTIVQKETSLGWILVRSACNLTWNAQNYTTCYHGYMHMANIPADLKVGSAVSNSTTLGTIDDVGAPGVNHLHFCAYVASNNRVGDVAAYRNGFLESVDPAAALGGPFANLSLASKVAVSYVDEQKSGNPYIFTPPPGAITDNALGFLDGMKYVSSQTSSSNYARWSFPGVAVSGEYALWAFIPRNHGTANVPYRVYKNGGLLGSYSVNQLSWSDQFINLFGYTTSQCGVSGKAGKSISLTAGDTIRVEAPQGTGTAGQAIALDAMYLIRKYADCNYVYK